jgi:hypothetical protein
MRIIAIRNSSFAFAANWICHSPRIVPEKRINPPELSFLFGVAVDLTAENARSAKKIFSAISAFFTVNWDAMNVFLFREADFPQ